MNKLHGFGNLMSIIQKRSSHWGFVRVNWERGDYLSKGEGVKTISTPDQTTRNHTITY